MAEGLAREGFDVDLRFGETRESAFVQAISRCHVECKSDQKARVTGNVFIETHQKPRTGEWRPSGINTSVADWWAIEYDDDAWIVVRRPLLKALAAHAQSVHGGDENRYRGRLIPVEWLVTPWRKITQRDAA
jgi:hypothetical protein